MSESEYTFKNKFTTRPGDVKPDDCFAIKVVAVAGCGNDWAAYEGPSDWTDEQVVRSGDKLPAATAIPLFYVLGISRRTYREF